MNIHEYQAKRLFGQHGMAVPEGEVATTPDEARAIAERLGGRVVVKAQVHTGGRGKAGGVKLADNPDDAAAKAEAILGMDIKGHTVRKVLLDPAVAIASEIYLGIVLDRALRKPVIMASSEGGVDIEEVAATNPNAIVKVAVDPLLGLQPFQLRQLAGGVGLKGDQAKQLAKMVKGLLETFVSIDATLVEVNPLVVLDDGNLLAIDGKVNLDDSAGFRHPEWRSCAILPTRPMPSARRAKQGCPTSTWMAPSAAWSMALAWLWPPWTSSSSAAARRPTSSTSVAELK